MPPSFVLELEGIVRQQKGAWVRLAQMHDIVLLRYRFEGERRGRRLFFDNGLIGGCRMTKRRPWIARAGAGALSALLVFSFVPLAGCSSAETSGSEDSGSATSESELLDNAPRSASEDPGGSAQAATVDYDTSTYVSPEEKWGSIDDGSAVLDVVEPYVNENAASRTLTVKTEGAARFADSVSTDAVTATGGMAEWAVASISRLSDTEISVELVRPGSVSDAAMAASSAGLSIAAACVEVPTEGSPEDDAALQEVREKLEASSEEDGETFLSENDESIDLAALESDATYDVSVPFVHPSLLVDVADTQVGESTTAYRIIASEFAFPTNVSVGDFSVELSASAPTDAVVPTVQNVTRVNDFELDVVVSSDASVQGGPLDYAVLAMNAASSGTGGEVRCPLVLPDAWVDAEVVAFDGDSVEDFAANSEQEPVAEEEGASEDGDYLDTVTVNTVLHNADASVEESITVSVLATDGTYKEVKAVQTQINSDSVDRTFNIQDLRDAAYGGADAQPQANGENAGEGLEDEVALARSAAESDMVVLSVDAPAVASAYGGADQDPHPEMVFVALKSAAMPRMPLAASAASLSAASEASNSSVVSGLFDKAKGMLGPLASVAWGTARTTFLADTALGDRSNVDIYNKIVELQSQMSDLSVRLDQLSDRETAHYNANVVNEANKIISRVQSEYTLISGMYQEVVATQDAKEQSARIDALMKSSSYTIDSLIVDMGVLYGCIKTADASSGAGLIDVYDSMAMKSYNWGAGAAASRQQYRDTLSEVWANCTMMLYVVCGDEAYETKYRNTLADLQNKTSDVNAIVNAKAIDSSTYQKSSYTLKGKNEFVNPTGANAYLCYTTNEWYVPLTGNASKYKWDSVWTKFKKRGHTQDRISTCPFILWNTDKAVPSWDSLYVGKAQMDLLQARSPRTRSLQDELRVFVTSGVPTHLLTSVSFDCSKKTRGKDARHNDWYFSSYDETSSSTQSKYVEKTQMFAGVMDWPSFKKTTKDETMRMEPDQLMVLAKTK